MLELTWRPRAQLDRESIALYLGFEKQAPEAALAAIRRIDQAIERVRAFPDSGGRFVADGLDKREYHSTLASPYIVFYRFDSSILTVCRILHQRQNIDDFTLIDLPE